MAEDQAGTTGDGIGKGARWELGGLTATIPQVKALYRVALGALGLSEEAVDRLSMERYDRLPERLTRLQAAEWIDEMRASVGKE